MNVYTKPIITIALLLAAASSVQASNSLSNKDYSHQRPSFESIDANADGDIDFDEFSSHKLPNGDHQTVFNLIDTDNNGVITQDEFDTHKPPCPKHAKGGRHD